MAASFGIRNLVLGDNPSMEGSYILQIQKKQKAYVNDPSFKTTNYTVQKAYCNDLTEDDLTDWRLPTELELHEVWYNHDKFENLSWMDPLVNMWIWSSSVWNNGGNGRCRVDKIGRLDYNYTNKEGAVRCVRIKK